MQDKIVLKHSRIEIHNYDWGDCPRLEYIFSIYDPIRHSSYLKGIDYDQDKRILYLPRGMDIEYLKSMFDAEPLIDRNSDPFIINNPIPIKYLPRDARQIELLEFTLGKNRYQYTASYSQIAINTTTGSGKTYITVGTMCFTGERMIVITARKSWLDQWREKIKEYTPLTDNEIYTIAGAGSISKLLNRDPLQYQAFLISHSTLSSYGEKCGWESVSELIKYMGCSLKVFDEAHMYFDNMCMIDYHTNVRKTLYLTATPLLSDDQENIIYQMYFKNIPSIVLFDESEDPHVHYRSLLYNSHPSYADTNSFCRGQYKFDRNVYMGYLVNQENFLRMVDIIFDTTINMKGKILIYVGINEALIKIYEYLTTSYPFIKDHVGIFTSLVTDPVEREQALRMKYILSTTKSTGAASDIPDLAAVVILDEPFKSEVIARQTLGRCRAPNTFCIDCVDTGTYKTKAWYKNKEPVYQMYAKSCVEHVFSDEELFNVSEAIRCKYATKLIMCTDVFKR